MTQGSFRSQLGIMFEEINGGESGGRSPPGKQGNLGGRQTTQIIRKYTIKQFFAWGPSYAKELIGHY